MMNKGGSISRNFCRSIYLFTASRSFLSYLSPWKILLSGSILEVDAFQAYTPRMEISTVSMIPLRKTCVYATVEVGFIHSRLSERTIPSILKRISTFDSRSQTMRGCNNGPFIESLRGLRSRDTEVLKALNGIM